MAFAAFDMLKFWLQRLGLKVLNRIEGLTGGVSEATSRKRHHAQTQGVGAGPSVRQHGFYL